MATNVFLNNFGASDEQSLLEDLIIESIRNYGQDMWYVPRRLDAMDKLFGESRVASFNSAYLFEFYVKSVDGFTGDGNFFAKFGLEIRDQITLTVARKTFNDECGAIEMLDRPREGDLVYFPLNKKCFQIKFVDDKPFFYQLGTLMTYDLVCEVFEYSHETFATGVPEIDAIQTRLDAAAESFSLLTTDGDPLVTEDGERLLVSEKWRSPGSDPIVDNDVIQDESDTIVDFSESDPFSENGRW